jgi:hypothetical protein
MSVTVGSPNRSSAKSLGRSDFSFGPLPIRVAMSSVLVAARMRCTTG